jgi:hypothetical protein
VGAIANVVPFDVASCNDDRLAFSLGQSVWSLHIAPVPPLERRFDSIAIGQQVYQQLTPPCSATDCKSGSEPFGSRAPLALRHADVHEWRTLAEQPLQVRR